MKNPYTLLFGRAPEQLIQRTADKAEILQNFSYDLKGTRYHVPGRKDERNLQLYPVITLKRSYIQL